MAAIIYPPKKTPPKKKKERKKEKETSKRHEILHIKQMYIYTTMKPSIKFEYLNLKYNSTLPDWSIPGYNANHLKIKVHNLVRAEPIYISPKYGVSAIYR